MHLFMHISTHLFMQPQPYYKCEKSDFVFICFFSDIGIFFSFFLIGILCVVKKRDFPQEILKKVIGTDVALTLSLALTFALTFTHTHAHSHSHSLTPTLTRTLMFTLTFKWAVMGDQKDLVDMRLRHTQSKNLLLYALASGIIRLSFSLPNSD